MGACGMQSCYHCRLAPIFKPYAGQKLSNGQICDIARKKGFSPMSVCLPNDHSVQMNNPKEPPNNAPFCCPKAWYGCWELKIPIFTRIAPRKGYIVSQIQYYCDGTPC